MLLLLCFVFVFLLLLIAYSFVYFALFIFIGAREKPIEQAVVDNKRSCVCCYVFFFCLFCCFLFLFILVPLKGTKVPEDADAKDDSTSEAEVATPVAAPLVPDTEPPALLQSASEPPTLLQSASASRKQRRGKGSFFLLFCFVFGFFWLLLIPLFVLKMPPTRSLLPRTVCGRERRSLISFWKSVKT